jgi:acetoin utilization protein AcuB
VHDQKGKTMRLEEIMSKDVATIDVDTEAVRALTEMRGRNVHHLVAMEGERPVGVISQQDLVAAGSTTPVRELMSRRFVQATPDTTVRDAANLLRGHHIGCLPVIDGGRLVGIVTLTDLLELIGRGVERPVAESKRWTLRRRAPSRKPEPST